MPTCTSCRCGITPQASITMCFACYQTHGQEAIEKLRAELAEKDAIITTLNNAAIAASDNELDLIGQIAAKDKRIAKLESTSPEVEECVKKIIHESCPCAYCQESLVRNRKRAARIIQEYKSARERELESDKAELLEALEPFADAKTKVEGGITEQDSLILGGVGIFKDHLNVAAALLRKHGKDGE